MKALICISCLLSLAVICSGQALIVFGDSLSDAGPRPIGLGYAKWVQQTLLTTEVTPEPPYSNGRFSNGPVWVDYAAQNLGINYVDFACGGSTTGLGLSQNAPLSSGFAGIETNDTSINAPTLGQQLVQFYQTSNNTANPQNVYAINIGSNDFFSFGKGERNFTYEDLLNVIQEAMNDLYLHGARKFVVWGLAPVAALPPDNLANQPLVDNWSAFSPGLQALASNFSASYAGSSAGFFDFSAIFFEVASNLTKYGFTTLAPCYPTPVAGVGEEASGIMPCNDPNQHVLWDSVHPTTKAHSILGQAFSQQFATLFGKPYSGAPTPAPAASATGR